MYGGLTARVKTDQGLSSYFPCHIGTRQGCVSSPLIFTLFIYDLVTLLREIPLSYWNKAGLRLKSSNIHFVHL